MVLSRKSTTFICTFDKLFSLNYNANFDDHHKTGKLK